MEKRKVIIRKVDGEILKGYAEQSLDPVNGKESSVTVTSLTEELIPCAEVGDQSTFLCSQVFREQRVFRSEVL